MTVPNSTLNPRRPHRWCIAAKVVTAIVLAAVIADSRPAGAHPADTLPGDGRADRFQWVSSDGPGWWTVQQKPTPVPRAMVTLPSDVSFERGSGALADLAGVDAALAPLADAVHRGAATGLTIDAHASADGSARGNLELSLHRGEAVRGRLVAAGVPVERVTVVAHGESDLPDPADPEAPGNRVVIIRATTGG